VSIETGGKVKSRIQSIDVEQTISHSEKVASRKKLAIILAGPKRRQNGSDSKYRKDCHGNALAGTPSHTCALAKQRNKFIARIG